MLELLMDKDGNSDWASPEIRQSWLEECERREQLVRDGKMQTFAAAEVHRRLDRMLAK
jgi:hypothetical protein